MPQSLPPETRARLKNGAPGADSGAVTDAPHEGHDAAEVARLRHRLRELARRRDRAVERVGLFPNAANERQLEAMRFELAELEWRIAELEGAPSAR